LLSKLLRLLRKFNKMQLSPMLEILLLASKLATQPLVLLWPLLTARSTSLVDSTLTRQLSTLFLAKSVAPEIVQPPRFNQQSPALFPAFSNPLRPLPVLQLKKSWFLSSPPEVHLHQLLPL
jgi:hypothetical protein